MPCVHGIYGYCMICHQGPSTFGWPNANPFHNQLLVLTCSACRRFFPHELVGVWQDEPLPTECAACVRSREEKNTAILRSLEVEG